MAIDVELPDGRTVSIETDNPQQAARAAKMFMDKNPMNTSTKMAGADSAPNSPPSPAPAPRSMKAPEQRPGFLTRMAQGGNASMIDTVGIVANPINALIDMGLQAVGSDARLGSFSDAARKVAGPSIVPQERPRGDAAYTIGEYALNPLNLVGAGAAQNTARAGAGMLGRALGSPVTRNVGYGVASGMGAATAQQIAPDSAVAEIVGAVGTPLAGSKIASLGGMAARNFMPNTKNVSSATASEKAGGMLVDEIAQGVMGGQRDNPAGVRQAVSEALPGLDEGAALNRELGTRLMAGDASGNVGLLSAQQNVGQYARPAVLDAQKTTRNVMRDELRGISPEPTPVGRTVADMGQAVRGELQASKDTTKAALSSELDNAARATDGIDVAPLAADAEALNIMALGPNGKSTPVVPNAGETAGEYLKRLKNATNKQAKALAGSNDPTAYQRMEEVNALNQRIEQAWQGTPLADAYKKYGSEYSGVFRDGAPAVSKILEKKGFAPYRLADEGVVKVITSNGRNLDEAVRAHGDPARLQTEVADFLRLQLEQGASPAKIINQNPHVFKKFPGIERQLQENVVQNMVGELTSRAAQNDTSMRKIIDVVGDEGNRRLLESVGVKPDQMKRIEKLTRAAEMADEGLRGGKLPGTSNTISEWFKGQTKDVMSLLWLMGGGKTSALGPIASLSGWAMSKLSPFSRQASTLFHEAILDPEIAKTLLMDATQQNERIIVRRLQQHMDLAKKAGVATAASQTRPALTDER